MGRALAALIEHELSGAARETDAPGSVFARRADVRLANSKSRRARGDSVTKRSGCGSGSNSSGLWNSRSDRYGCSRHGVKPRAAPQGRP